MMLTQSANCVNLGDVKADGQADVMGDPGPRSKPRNTPTDATRRAAIHAAAIGEFSKRGFAATSMSNIATAAGMSRPALYQYFRNKSDIFASAFTALVDGAVDRALAALAEPGSTAQQLDGFLQRSEGDLWERMAASPHSNEIVTAKYEHAADGVAAVMQRHWAGLREYLKRVGPGGRSRDSVRRRAGWAEMLEFAPRGLKSDQPSVEVYRERLTALARSVAADIEASRATRAGR